MLNIIKHNKPSSPNYQRVKALDYIESKHTEVKIELLYRLTQSATDYFFTARSYYHMCRLTDGTWLVPCHHLFVCFFH